MAKQAKLTFGKREDLKKKMMAFRAEAEEGNKGTFRRMTENERMKIGKQWNESDKEFNEAHGKFALTVNEILPIVLDIAGTQEENPLDVKVRNVKGGTQTIAQILTSLAKKVMDDSMGREEGSRAFESGVTTARGWLQLNISSDNDPLNGDFKIDEIDPFMVLPDPTCKLYDYNKTEGGAKYIIVDKWIDKGKVEAKYPGFKQQIKDANFDPTRTEKGPFGALMSHLFSSGATSRFLRDDYRFFDESNTGINDEELTSNVTKATNNYRESVYWWKSYKKGIYIQRLDDPLNYKKVTKPRDISFARKAAEQDENIKIIDKDRDGNPIVIPVMNKTIMYGDVLVEHIEDPHDGLALYTIVRFAPYFDHGYEYPPVENLIGPQKLLNFTFSTTVNILKNLANTGWIVSKGSQILKKWLGTHGSQDGIIIDKSKYGDVKKIEPNQYPVGMDAMTERSKQNMREIAQVALEVPNRGKESGRALAIREQQSLKTKGIIFRNWNQTNIMLGRLLVDMIRNTNVFSDDEIMAIIDEEDLIDPKIFQEAMGVVARLIQQQGGTLPTQPPAINPLRIRALAAKGPEGTELAAQTIDKFQDDTEIFKQGVEQMEAMATPIARDIMLSLLRKMQQGRYGVKVDTSPMAPTMRMVRSLELQELDKTLIEGGRPGVSRKLLIEGSDVQNKEEIISDVHKWRRRWRDGKRNRNYRYDRTGKTRNVQVGI